MCVRVCVFRDVPQEEESGTAQGYSRNDGLVVCLHGSLVMVLRQEVCVYVCMYV